MFWKRNMLEQTFMERIRSQLVGINNWDYIVFWKLSDDHRCLELMDCICSGTQSSTDQKNGEGLVFSAASNILSCRDVLFTHPRMKSCNLLDNIDTSITLEFSGVYAETLLSNQARWLNFSYNSDSNASQETLGTKVLVPVLPFGLLELFVTQQVPEDQEIVDFIKTQCNLFIEQQIMSFSSDPILRKESFRSSQPQISPETSRINSNTIGTSPFNPYQMNDEKISSLIEENNKSDDSDDQEDQNDIAKFRKKSGKGHQAKNLEAERKRRKKLNDRLYHLRALVPNISKLDRSAILVDAIDYVKELQKQVSDLQLELEEHSDDETITQSGTTHGPKHEHEKFLNGKGSSGNVIINISSKQDSKIKLTNEKVQQMEAQVEVFKLDGNELFVKIFCEHKPGGFVELMEAFNYLGLEVSNVNATRHTCLVSNIFKVKDSKNAQADYVKESLLELTRNPLR